MAAAVDSSARATRGDQLDLQRVGGIAGLVFLGGVVLQNGVLLMGNPLPSASLADIDAFYRGAESRIATAVGLVALNIVMLLFFGSAVASRLDTNPAGRLAGRVGFGAVVLLGGAFLSTTYLQATLASRVGSLADQGQLQLLWDVHSAAFSMSATSLGAVLTGFSIGALLTRTLVPAWTAVVGLVGAACLLLAGGLVVSTLGGGPGIYLQLVGFATWLLFVLVASIRLIRGPRSPAT